MFRFKQFTILQNQSAMKVGTDGVLLGAWTPIDNVNNVLDIGTGTGLIALMLAQRNKSSFIDALEVEDAACYEAKLNFQNSDWSKRLTLHQTPVEDYQTNKKYDLVVSNPPYYTDTFTSPNTSRTLARHVEGLTFKKLLNCTLNLLEKDGNCSFIIPCKEEVYFLKIAASLGLFPLKITRVKGNKTATAKRSLLLLSRKQVVCVFNELVIEIERHVYTEQYIELTQEFYLKM